MLLFETVSLEAENTSAAHMEARPLGKRDEKNEIRKRMKTADRVSAQRRSLFSCRINQTAARTLKALCKL